MIQDPPFTPESCNPAIETIIHDLLMSADGEDEFRLMRLALESIRAQTRLMEPMECLNLPGFEVGLCSYLEARIENMQHWAGVHVREQAAAAAAAAPDPGPAMPLPDLDVVDIINNVVGGIINLFAGQDVDQDSTDDEFDLVDENQALIANRDENLANEAIAVFVQNPAESAAAESTAAEATSAVNMSAEPVVPEPTAVETIPTAESRCTEPDQDFPEDAEPDDFLRENDYSPELNDINWSLVDYYNKRPYGVKTPPHD